MSHAKLHLLPLTKMASSLANRRRSGNECETGTSTLILLQYWVITAEKCRHLITWSGSIQYETLIFQHSGETETEEAGSKYCPSLKCLSVALTCVKRTDWCKETNYQRSTAHAPTLLLYIHPSNKPSPPLQTFLNITNIFPEY